MDSELTTLLQGTLHLLIFEIACRARDAWIGNFAQNPAHRAQCNLVVKPDWLFPAGHRMDGEGWISSLWGDSENNRPTKYYPLTKAGLKQLEIETKRWGRISWDMAQVLEAS